MTAALHGSIKGFWGHCATCADNNLVSSLWSHVTVVGSFRGKGRYATVAMDSNATMTFKAHTDALSKDVFTDVTHCNTASSTATGMCLIDAPAGGIAQFKGLTQGT
jgi:hypothetical protein